MFVAVYIYFASGIFSKEHAIIDFHVERGDFSILTYLSLTHRDHLSFLRLFLGGIRDDDPARGLFIRLDPADENAIVKRPESHVPSPSFLVLR